MIACVLEDITFPVCLRMLGLRLYLERSLHCIAASLSKSIGMVSLGRGLLTITPSVAGTREHRYAIDKQVK